MSDLDAIGFTVERLKSLGVSGESICEPIFRNRILDGDVIIISDASINGSPVIGLFSKNTPARQAIAQMLDLR